MKTHLFPNFSKIYIYILTHFSHTLFLTYSFSVNGRWTRPENKLYQFSCRWRNENSFQQSKANWISPFLALMIRKGFFFFSRCEKSWTTGDSILNRIQTCENFNILKIYFRRNNSEKFCFLYHLSTLRRENTCCVIIYYFWIQNLKMFLEREERYMVWLILLS